SAQAVSFPQYGNSKAAQDDQQASVSRTAGAPYRGGHSHKRKRLAHLPPASGRESRIKAVISFVIVVTATETRITETCEPRNATADTSPRTVIVQITLRILSRLPRPKLHR